MSKHSVVPVAPAPISPNRFSQNGRLPNPIAWNKAAQSANQAAVLAKKCHFSYGYNTTGTYQVPAATGSSVSHLQPLIRTGKNVARIKALVAAMTVSSGNTLAGVKLALTDSAGASTTSDTMRCTNRLPALGTDGPGHLQWGILTVEAPTENELFRVGVNLTNSARILSVAIFEESDIRADSTASVCVNPNAFQVNSNIYDSDAASLLTAQNELWKYCAPPLIVWSRTDQTNAPTFSGTTYTNIVDSGFTAHSSTSPGFYIDSQYLTTRSRTTVPVMLLVYATRLTGTGSLNIRLTDGTTTVTSTTITSPLANPCYSEALTIPAQAEAKWDVFASVTGSGTWRLESLSLIQYEA